MAKVRMRSRISAILLSSDNALTCQGIHELYPGRKPTLPSLRGVLASYPEFISIGVTKVRRKSADGHSPAHLWTHIDHALVYPKEEE